MSWLDFVEKMVGHLAWPIVALIVIFAVRKHLGSLAERILELSFGGATVKFDKLLSKGAELIEQQAKDKEIPEISSEEMAKGLARHLNRIKDFRSMPADEGLALKLFRDIELLLIDIGKLCGINPRWGQTLHAREVVLALRSQKRDRGFGELFDTLQEGRNVIAHSKKLGPAEIEEYVRQASFFLVQLEIWREQLERKNHQPPKQGN